MDNEQHFIEGFNSGFLLAKYEPILLMKVLQNLRAKNDYVKGLFSGKEEFEIEQTKDYLKQVYEIRSQSLNRNNGLERDF